MDAWMHLQLSSSRVQVCESSGNRLKSMLHIAVTVILEIQKRNISVKYRKRCDWVTDTEKIETQKYPCWQRKKSNIRTKEMPLLGQSEGYKTVCKSRNNCASLKPLCLIRRVAKKSSGWEKGTEERRESWILNPCCLHLMQKHYCR